MSESRQSTPNRTTPRLMIGSLMLALIGIGIFIATSLTYRGSSGSWAFVFLPLGIGACLSVALASWINRARQMTGVLCPACGYDLRGIDSKQRQDEFACSECGRGIKAGEPLDVYVSPAARLVDGLITTALLLGAVMAIMFAFCNGSLLRGGALGDV